MKSGVSPFLMSWAFPTVMAIAYWLFDTLMVYSNPTVIVPATFWTAIFPDVGSAPFYFRIALTVATVYGAWLFEKTMRKLGRIQKQLFLSEYAVENTRAFEMLWCDAEGQIIKANKYAAERLGYTKKELLSLHVKDISPTHNDETWRRLRALLKEKGEAKYVTQHRTKSGMMIPAVMHIQFLRSKDQEYQFAFVCEARLCPMVDACSVAPCGHPPLPNMVDFLDQAAA